MNFRKDSIESCKNGASSKSDQAWKYTVGGQLWPVASPMPNSVKRLC